MGLSALPTAGQWAFFQSLGASVSIFRVLSPLFDPLTSSVESLNPEPFTTPASYYFPSPGVDKGFGAHNIARLLVLAKVLQY